MLCTSHQLSISGTRVWVYMEGMCVCVVEEVCVEGGGLYVEGVCVVEEVCVWREEGCIWRVCV